MFDRTELIIGGPFYGKRTLDRGDFGEFAFRHVGIRRQVAMWGAHVIPISSLTLFPSPVIWHQIKF